MFRLDLSGIIIMLFAILAPIQTTMFAIAFLLIADFITGICASLKTKEAITSKKMSHTVIKLILYNFAIVVSMIVEYYLVPEIPFIRIAAGFIALTEINSFYENINKITGLDIWKAVKAWIQTKKEDVKDISK